jgi:hypothetical protein
MTLSSKTFDQLSCQTIEQVQKNESQHQSIGKAKMIKTQDFENSFCFNLAII